MKVTKIFLFIFLIFISISNLIFAGTTGKIVGTVTDKSTGDMLIGANIVLEGSGLGASTDQDGYFAILNIPPGVYTLTVYYVGYSTLKIQNVNVSIDRTTTRNVELTPEAIRGEEIIVEAKRPAVEMDRTHSASIVSSKTVDSMPVTEINEVLQLQAGVVSTDGELHFRGGRAREVAYIVDGIPVSNSYSQNGGNNVEIENSMIQELEVITGTFNAEYGSAQSGVVNIVTKKPEDKFSGTLQLYSGEWLSSKNNIYMGVSNFNPLAEKDMQLSLSGPILHGKMGYFISGRFNNWQSLEWYDRRFVPVDGWRIAAYRLWYQQHFMEQTNATGVIYIPDSLGTGDRSKGPLVTGNSLSLNGKLIFLPRQNISITYQFFGSFDKYNGLYNTTTNQAFSFRRYQPDEAGKILMLANSHFLRFQHTLTTNLYYNLAFSYQHNDGESYYRKDNKVALYPGDTGIQPITSGSNGFTLGSTGGFYTGKDGRGYIDQYLANGDIDWQLGKHNFIKAGFLAKQHYINVYSRGFRESREWTNNSFPLQEELNGANMSFPAYWDSLIGYWQNWESRFHTTPFIAIQDTEVALYRDFNITPVEAAFYVQDKLELGDIIANAGLRLDVFQPNEKVPVNFRTESFNLGAEANLRDATVKYQLSPRVGLSFPISSNGAFHAAYGHFFQMPSFQYMYNAPLVIMTPLQLNGFLMGNADLEPEKTITYEVGLQQGITRDLAVDVTAYYKDFKNLLGIEQINTIDNISYQRYINRDYGNARGITIGFTKNGDFVNGGVNYSLAFANGSSSDPQALELINTAIQYGGENVVFAERKILPLNWDQRHTINAFINLVREAKWSLGLVGFYDTGVPFSPTFVERFDIAEREYRNSASKPARWSIDLKAKKMLKIGDLETTLFLKIDNIFDHLNQEQVYASTGRADQIARVPDEQKLLEERLRLEGLFTLNDIDIRPENFSQPRKVQLGLEVKF